MYLLLSCKLTVPSSSLCLCTGVHFLTKKTSKFGCHNPGGGILAESGPVGLGRFLLGLGRCLSTKLEVTKQ